MAKPILNSDKAERRFYALTAVIVLSISTLFIYKAGIV